MSKIQSFKQFILEHSKFDDPDFFASKDKFAPGDDFAWNVDHTRISSYVFLFSKDEEYKHVDEMTHAKMSHAILHCVEFDKDRELINGLVEKTFEKIKEFAEKTPENLVLRGVEAHETSGKSGKDAIAFFEKSPYKIYIILNTFDMINDKEKLDPQGLLPVEKEIFAIMKELSDKYMSVLEGIKRGFEPAAMGGNKVDATSPRITVEDLLQAIKNRSTIKFNAIRKNDPGTVRTYYVRFSDTALLGENKKDGKVITFYKIKKNAKPESKGSADDTNVQAIVKDLLYSGSATPIEIISKNFKAALQKTGK